MKSVPPSSRYHTDQGRLPVAGLNDVWWIQNPSLAYLNETDAAYKVVRARERTRTTHAVFYVSGMTGTLETMPGLEDLVCPHSTLVRVEPFGFRNVWTDVVATTFGDLCALLRTGRQCVSAIADQLGLRSFDIIGHSWGGMIALQAAMRDPRCRRVMPLASTPDFCDAVMHIYHLVPALPSFAALLDRVLSGHMRREAQAAKFGQSRHQAAWEALSPWRIENFRHRGFSLAYCNRDEDPIMTRRSVEHWLAWAAPHRLDVRAEFVALPENRNLHDMPLATFGPAMERFLFGSAAERIVRFPRAVDRSAAAG